MGGGFLLVVLVTLDREAVSGQWELLGQLRDRDPAQAFSPKAPERRLKPQDAREPPLQ